MIFPSYPRFGQLLQNMVGLWPSIPYSNGTTSPHMDWWQSPSKSNFWPWHIPFVSSLRTGTSPYFVRWFIIYKLWRNYLQLGIFQILPLRKRWKFTMALDPDMAPDFQEVLEARRGWCLRIPRTPGRTDPRPIRQGDPRGAPHDTTQGFPGTIRKCLFLEENHQENPLKTIRNLQ